MMTSSVRLPERSCWLRITRKLRRKRFPESPCVCVFNFHGTRQLNGEVVKMSNKEWYDFIYPENDDMPYMYNEFRWDHCL